MGYETILYEAADGVALVTLNRPEVMNAWNDQLSRELTLALTDADADPSVRAVVITGAGRAFCAGADLSAGDATFRGGLRERAPEPPPTPKWPYQLTKPVIAAINGHAVGVGITFPLLCDLRIVANEAKIQFAFVRRGVMPELASHTILPRVVGFARAAELLVTGRMISGAEAAEMGLANRALPAADVLPAALEIAHDVAVNVAPVSAAVAKRLLWDGMTMGVDDMRAREDPLFAFMARRPDAGEGVVSFLEKRPPVWPSNVPADLPPML
ncbi:MAG TPA: enoyl-CoA hydratase-related protein [Acidimicrobiales bacterium]